MFDLITIAFYVAFAYAAHREVIWWKLAGLAVIASPALPLARLSSAAYERHHYNLSDYIFTAASGHLVLFGVAIALVKMVIKPKSPTL